MGLVERLEGRVLTLPGELDLRGGGVAAQLFLGGVERRAHSLDARRGDDLDELRDDLESHPVLEGVRLQPLEGLGRHGSFGLLLPTCTEPGLLDGGELCGLDGSQLVAELRVEVLVGVGHDVLLSTIERRCVARWNVRPIISIRRCQLRV